MTQESTWSRSSQATSQHTLSHDVLVRWDKIHASMKIIWSAQVWHQSCLPARSQLFTSRLRDRPDKSLRGSGFRGLGLVSLVPISVDSGPQPSTLMQKPSEISSQSTDSSESWVTRLRKKQEVITYHAQSLYQGFSSFFSLFFFLFYPVCFSAQIRK